MSISLIFPLKLTAVGERELVNIPEFVLYGWKLKRSEKLGEKVSIFIRGCDMLNYDTFDEGLPKREKWQVPLVLLWHAVLGFEIV